MTNDRVCDIYDRRAASYDRSVGRLEHLALNDLRAQFGAALRGRTLEIAIGSGLNLPHYTSAVTEAVGVDFSDGMLREARIRANQLDQSIALRRMDAHRLEFDAGSFDTVAISLALCTVSDPAAVLREMARVCRPEGRIVLLEHVRSPIRPIGLLLRLATPLQNRIIGCHLDRRSIDLARELGFQFDEEQRRLAGIVRLAIGRPPAL